MTTQKFHMSPEISFGDTPIFHRDTNGDMYVRNERKENRLILHENVTYKRKTDGKDLLSKLHDMGRGGMGMIAKWPYLPGTKLFIKSSDSPSGTLHSARVVWSKKDKASSHAHPKYRIGLRFTHQ